MSQPDPPESVTLDQLAAAVHKTGFVIVDKGGGPTLERPDKPGHVPAHLMQQLKVRRQELIDWYPTCEKCKAEYKWLCRREVGKLCDNAQCPLRSMK